MSINASGKPGGKIQPGNIYHFYKKKTILITGSTGYLASHLINTLKDLDCSIICLSRPGAQFQKLKNSKATVVNIHCDISKPEIWDRLAEEVDIIFHFAAQVSYCGNNDPLEDMRINFLPIAHLMGTCSKKKLSPIVLLAGTVTEIGLSESLPVNEEHPARPLTFYDFHKLQAERYLEHCSNLNIVRGACLRLANIYGPSFKRDHGVLNIVINRAISGKPLTVYENRDKLRDFIYIDDVITAFLMAGQYIDKMNGRHFIIGSGKGHSISRVIKLVAERVSAKLMIDIPIINAESPKPLLPIEFRDFTADISLIKKTIGWEPVVPLPEGLERTIEYYLNHTT